MDEDKIELTASIQRSVPSYEWVTFLDETTGELITRRQMIEPGYRDVDGNWIPTAKKKKRLVAQVQENVYLLDETREDLDRPNRMTIFDADGGIFDIPPMLSSELEDDDIIDPI